MRKFRVVPMLLVAALSMKASTLLTEGFNNISSLPGNGWVFQNNSTGAATSTSWFQGDPATFSAFAGPADSYAGANFLNASFGGDISNWMMTPTVTLENGDVFTFWTKSDAALADRLELRLSTNGASTDVGATESSVGDFTMLLLSVNPSLTGGGYPAGWVPKSVVLSGLNGTTTGRFGFRYFVTDTSSNGDYIGIDSVSYATPEPGSLSLLISAVLMGGSCLILKRKRGDFRGR